MAPSDQELYDQLLGYLEAEGAVNEDRRAGVVVLTEFDHRVLGRPLRLHVTPATLGRHLRDAAADASGLHPDVDPVDAAWRLFTVHLDEAVQTAKPGETELVLAPHGVIPVRPDLTPEPRPDGLEAHLERQRHYERIVSDVAERGSVAVEPGTSTVLIDSLDGLAFDPPLRLSVDVAALARIVDPSPDREAAYRTVVARIVEAARARTGGAHLVLGTDGTLRSS